MEPPICELCHAPAAVFCPSDAAYLCSTCDAQVHQANFLVARHFRQPLLRTDDSLSSSNASSKSWVSKSRPPMGYFDTGDVLLNWIRKIGVGDEGAVGIGYRAFDVCSDRCKGWPLRLRLAASLCLGLKAAKSRMNWRVLKRVEHLSGVPAKLILAAESKLECAATRGGRRRVEELEEGWAEC